MKIFVVCLVAFLLSVSTQGVSEEISVADNLLTLSIEEVEMVSEAFSVMCDQVADVEVSAEQALPYLYTFVRRCERFVLEEGSFPYDLSARLFDHRLASVVGVPGPASDFYSHLAVYLLQGAWRNAVGRDVESFLQLDLHGMDESFDPAMVYSEELYVASAILSALMDGPHSSLSDRIGVRADLLFSTAAASENRRSVAEQEEGEVKESLQLQSQSAEKEQVRELHVFATTLFVFSVTFSINVFAVALLFFVVRQRRRNGFPFRR